MQRCPFCGSEDLIHSASRGDTVCGNPACGEILEEKAMVADVSFVRTSSGAVAQAGQRVMWSGLGNFSAGAYNQDLCLSRGVTKIRWISDRLNLNSQLQEAGRRMYQLAVQMNFNCGRSSKFVACACLYMVCRRNKSPHLLIDFSDVVQTPVKTLGKVYCGLLKRLVGGRLEQQQAISDGVAVPLIDPSIFIERYARKMELRGMQRKVQNTAMRVIKFMHRDWICTGRRPNGLCGAALLIASFYHGLQCPASEIAEIVRMTEGTLKRRLFEMRETPMALMSRAQFEQADPDAAIEDAKRAKPPCMLARERREGLAQLLDKVPELTDKEGKLMALPGVSGNASDEVQVQSPALSAASEVRAEEDTSDAGSAGSKPKKQRLERALPPVPAWSSAAGDEGVGAGSPGSADSSARASSSSSAAPSGSVETEAKAQKDITTSSGQKSSVEKLALLEPSGNDIEDIASDITNKLLRAENAPLHEGGSGESKGNWQMTASLTAGRIAELDKQGPEFDDLLVLPHGSSSVGDALSESGQSGVEECLDDVDDTELLELYLLNEEEKEHKANIWQEVNKDYLEEWHERQKEKARRQQRETESSKNDTASETGSRTSSKRSSSRRSMYPPAESPVQSALMALTKKAKVRPDRINMKALENLFESS